MSWNKIIQLINHILFAVLIICSIAILIVAIDCLIVEGVRILLTKEGIKGMISFWSEYTHLLSSWFWIATLFIASRQLIKYIEEYHNRTALEEANAVIKIRNLLDYSEDNFKIHSALDSEKEAIFPAEEVDQMKWYRYLGTIELIGIMLNKGIISDDVFDNQFGYRVRNIENCSSLMNHIRENSRDWTELLNLINQVRQRASNS